MTGFTPMSAQDALWLTMDRPNNLMVVDGAMVLAGVPELEAVRAVFRTAVARFPVLRRRAVRQGSTWVWQDDPAFELDRLVTEVRLPEPADMAALQRFVAQQRAVPLKRSRPLWRGFLVHPLRMEDGTEASAVVTGFHHAIADGVRLTQVMLSMLSDERSAATADMSGRRRTLAAEHATAGSSSGESSGSASAVAPGRPGLVLTGLTGVAGLVRAASSVVGSAASSVASAAADPVGTLAAVPGAAVAVPARAASAVSSVAKLALAGSPPTVWSGTPGRAKAMAWSRPLPLDGIKAVGRAQGATVNDVMLAAVAGGLRRYLATRDAEVDEVTWLVPVNLKPFEDNLPAELGNYFALVMLPMPLGRAGPAVRVRQMHERMEQIKNSDEAMITFGLQRLLSMTPGQVSFLLTNFFANKTVGVLTNVPGPRGPMSFAGAPVKQVVGFAPCSGDNPMSATIFSYNGAVTVGFSTDAGLIPDPEALAGFVVDELAAIEAALGPVRVRRPRRLGVVPPAGRRPGRTTPTTSG
jgi:diacylglycerol O-acyltransferase